MTCRVAHVLNSPGRGGVPHVAHALIRHADRSRLAPHLFHLKPGPDTEPALDCPSATATGHGGKTGAMAELLGWLADTRIDILHCHSFRPNLHARLAGAALRPGLKIVAHYHNTYDDKWSDPQALALERHLGGVTDARIAVSGAVADHVSHRLGVARGSIEVVGNGIDPTRLANSHRARGRVRLGVDDDAQLIGLVGRLCRQKGPDVFVEAALALLRHRPDLRFVVVGDIEDNPLADDLCGRIAAAGQDKAIRLVGHQNHVGDILSALDILAAPSRWEGFGLAIAEAMWLGIPVVASAVDAIPEVTGGAAILVPPDDSRALAAALAGVLDNPSAARIRATTAQARANDLTWSVASARVQAVYDRIIQCPLST